MIRDFLKEGTIYSLAGFLSKGISLMLIPLFTRFFSPTDFGVLDLLYVFSMFFIAVFSFQIGQGMTRFIGETEISSSRKTHIASTGLFFVCASLLIGSILVLIFRSWILQALNLTHPSYEKTFFLAVISISLNGLFGFFGSHLLALRRKNIYAMTTFLHSLLGILATYYFVIVLQKSINGVFYATISIVPLVLLVQLYFLKSEYKLFFRKNLITPLLRYSLPLVPAAIAYVVLSLTDRICINYLLNKTELGIYSVGFKFSFGLSLLISGFSLALSPLIFQFHQDKETPIKLGKMLNGYILIGLVSVGLLSLFAQETVEWFTQLPYYGAASVMPMLYLSVWFTGLHMFSPGMNIAQKNGWIPIISLLSAGINVWLNLWLIPFLGIKGAALATLISSALNYTVLFTISRKYFPFPVEYWKMGLGVVLITLLLVNIELLNTLPNKLVFKSAILLPVLLVAGWYATKQLPQVLKRGPLS
jgi:O-antigen/teichoic acid export membrane protein